MFRLCAFMRVLFVCIKQTWKLNEAVLNKRKETNVEPQQTGAKHLMLQVSYRTQRLVTAYKCLKFPYSSGEEKKMVERLKEAELDFWSH